ncbi:alpha/beta hydrolase-fold protein [Thermodesulfobacteriota bacterium]
MKRIRVTPEIMKMMTIVSLLGLILGGCKVHGIVYDSNNYPIKGIQVQLTDMSTGEVMVGITNGEGEFNFNPVSDGQYRLTASRYGYQDLVKTFDKVLDDHLVKDAVMVNKSTVMVHRFEPPSLTPMKEIEPEIAVRDFSVYLPPSYQLMADKHYPVIYLLHGNGHNHLSYFNPYDIQLGLGTNLQSIMDELIAHGLSQELILVIPDGNLPLTWVPSVNRGSFFTNSAYNGDFERFVAEDLVDCIENNADHCLWDDSDFGYRVIPSGGSRAIDGICMGGLGALNMGFHYPGRFAAVACNFGLATLNEFIFPFGEGVDPILTKYFGDEDFAEFVNQRIEAMFAAFDGEHYPDYILPISFGPEGEVIMTMVENPEDPEGPLVELWSHFFLRYDPRFYLMDHPEAIEGLSFYLDCGDHDSYQLWDNTAAISAALEDLGLEPSLSLGPENRHFYEIYPNLAHVDFETHGRVVKALTFLANHLDGDES